MGQALHKRTYRLKLADDGHGLAREVEFEAEGARDALRLAQSVCGTREIELFEDDRRLARVKRAAHGGFWVVSS